MAGVPTRSVTVQLDDAHVVAEVKPRLPLDRRTGGAAGAVEQVGHGRRVLGEEEVGQVPADVPRGLGPQHPRREQPPDLPGGVGHHCAVGGVCRDGGPSRLELGERGAGVLAVGDVDGDTEPADDGPVVVTQRAVPSVPHRPAASYDDGLCDVVPGQRAAHGVQHLRDGLPAVEDRGPDHLGGVEADGGAPPALQHRHETVGVVGGDDDRALRQRLLAQPLGVDLLRRGQRLALARGREHGGDVAADQGRPPGVGLATAERPSGGHRHHASAGRHPVELHQEPPRQQRSRRPPPCGESRDCPTRGDRARDLRRAGGIPLARTGEPRGGVAGPTAWSALAVEHGHLGVDQRAVVAQVLPLEARSRAGR